MRETTFSPKVPGASPEAPGLLLQRKCDCGNHTMSGSCNNCAKKKGSLQRKASNGIESSEAPPIVHDVLRSPGQPLDAATRAFFEPRFGHDFSQVPLHSRMPATKGSKLSMGDPGDRYEQEADRIASKLAQVPAPHEGHETNSRLSPNFSKVRIHADAKAAESARAVNALAYAAGWDIVFGEGQFAPQTNAGRMLLAHELTHVVQQAPLTTRVGTSVQRKVAAGASAAAGPKCPQPTSDDDCCDSNVINKTLDNFLQGYGIDTVDQLMDIPIAVYEGKRYCCCVVICQIQKPGQFSFEATKSKKYKCDCGPLEVTKTIGKGLTQGEVTLKLERIEDINCPQS